MKILSGCLKEKKILKMPEVKMKIQVIFEPVDDNLRFNPDAQVFEIAI
jgi:hypothetical protein